MNHRRRNLLRLAVDIHGRLTQHPQSVVAPCWPTDAWQRCQDLIQRMERAQLHGWLLAADRLRQELAFALALLRGRLTEASECLQSGCEDRRPVSPHDLYEDILALEDEFDEVTWNRLARTLSVITDPIELEQIHLGRFEICLDWSKLAVGSPYRVIARDPQPAASDDFWEKRDVRALAEEVGQWNEMIAAFAGKLKDQFGGDLEAPITDYSDFEHLEARGQNTTCSQDL